MSKITRRIGSHRNEHRVLKGVLHVQAIFNNTIVIVIDVWGEFYLGLLSFLVDSKSRGEVHHLIPILQQKILFIHLNGWGYGMNISYDKWLWLGKRYNITNHSYKWNTIIFCMLHNPYTT